MFGFKRSSHPVVSEMRHYVEGYETERERLREINADYKMELFFNENAFWLRDVRRDAKNGKRKTEFVADTEFDTFRANKIYAHIRSLGFGCTWFIRDDRTVFKITW
jgi:hypothetical protein